MSEQLGARGEERIVELLRGHLHGLGLALVAASSWTGASTPSTSPGATGRMVNARGS